MSEEKNKVYQSIEELLETAQSSLGVPFKEYDVNNRLNGGNKGKIGQVIEEGLFHKGIDSRQEADFPELGVELKVTPMNRVGKEKDMVSAKERLVVTMINYMKDYNVSFEDSHVLDKLNKVLLMFYFNEPKKMNYDLCVDKIFLYQFKDIPEADKQIIINDYNIIIDKIKSGHAEDISESDTYYLSACTKGATAATSFVDQPFSSVKAKRRAFSLKPKYMTALLRSQVFNDNAITKESLMKTSGIIGRDNIFDRMVEYLFSSYYGKSLSEIDEMIETPVNRKSLNYLRSYIARMMNASPETKSKDIDEYYDEFYKANIKIKTIRIKKDGTIKESMSFPAFKFKEIVEENWEDSELRNKFIDEKYLFCVFDEIDDSKYEYRFRGTFLWAMPESDLDGKVREAWERTVYLAKHGIEFTISENKNGLIVHNNLPAKKDNLIVHVRPHASKAIYVFNDGKMIGSGNIQTDGDELPDGTIVTKQCFFLNNDYVLGLVNKYLPLKD